MDDRITIVFPSREARAGFRNVYRGTGSWFYNPHPNYDGSLVDDRYLGCNTQFLLHLERSHVKDFRRLRQDAEMFDGRILI